MSDAAQPRSGHWIGQLSAILLGGLFVFSAYAKVLSPKAFVASVESYGILPAGWELPAATGVVALEVCLGVLLVLGIGRRLAAWISVPLLVVFLALLFYAKSAGIEECGCFGEVIKMSPNQEILLDIGLLLLAGLVIWGGTNLRLGGRGFRDFVALSTFALGAVIFLAAGPSGATEETLEVTMEQLGVLNGAQPPAPVPTDGFVFLFSADCPHCWSYSGAVQLMHDRLADFQVVAITMSDPQTLGDFQRDFSPRYPIHSVTESAFHEISAEYPAGIWLSEGQIAQTWAGHIPSHREIADLGGYEILEQPLVVEPVPEEEETPPPANDSPFGLPARGRH